MKQGIVYTHMFTTNANFNNSHSALRFVKVNIHLSEFEEESFNSPIRLLIFDILTISSRTQLHSNLYAHILAVQMEESNPVAPQRKRQRTLKDLEGVGAPTLLSTSQRVSSATPVEQAKPSPPSRKGYRIRRSSDPRRGKSTTEGYEGHGADQSCSSKLQLQLSHFELRDKALRENV
jgi:hypothetical protein